MEFGWWERRRPFTIAGVVLPPFPLSIVPPMIAVGVIVLGLLLFWQRQARKGEALILQAGLLRQPGFVLGTMAAMLHTLMTTGVQFNLYQYVPLALSLDPYRTALTSIPYAATKTLVIVGSVKLLKLGSDRDGETMLQRFSPKSIVFGGLSLLAIGMVMLYRGLTLNANSLALLPGLIVMGFGSAWFSLYISRLTYAAAGGSKAEGTGIYNPVQNLGNSLGRAILGTSLIFFASRDIVDGILQQMGQTVAPGDRVRLIATLQEMIQTLPRQEVAKTVINQLPPAVVPFAKQISLEATTSGMHTSLLLALALVGVCALLAATLPNYPSTQLR